jgi:hypothetical protein
MGGTTQTTSTQTSAPSNPEVEKTQTQLLKGLQDTYSGGIKVFNQSLYPGVGGTTQQGWNAMLGFANDPGYSDAIKSTIGDFGAIASGQRFGMNDPGYATLRQKVIDDTQSTINQQFGASGRFGGGSHVSSLGEGIGNAVAGLDYANYQSDVARQQAAAGMLPGLFNAGTLPASAIGAVGAAQDADALARRQAENDLFRRQNDTSWDTLARSSSILNGTAQSGGTTVTNSQPVAPWWQQVGGYILGNAGKAASVYGGGF